MENAKGLDDLERDLRSGMGFAPLALKQTADDISELRATIARLTAELAVSDAAKSAHKSRGDNHWETMRCIYRIAAEEGDIQAVIQHIRDAGQGYTERPEETLRRYQTDLASAESRADKAEAELIAAHKRIAELETAKADGYADGVRAVADMRITGIVGTTEFRPEVKREILALIPASPAEPAQCCICGNHGASTDDGGGPECQPSDMLWTCGPDCYDMAVWAISTGEDPTKPAEPDARNANAMTDDELAQQAELDAAQAEFEAKRAAELEAQG